jgi:hypothetical protein
VTRSLPCVRLDVHETIVVHNRCGVACCQSMFTSSRMTSGTPAGRYCPGTVSAQRGSTPHPEPGHADWLGRHWEVRAPRYSPSASRGWDREANEASHPRVLMPYAMPPKSPDRHGSQHMRAI